MNTPCISCGRAEAVLSNESGAFCHPCMQFNLLEKMFVALTKLQQHHEQPRTCGEPELSLEAFRRRHGIARNAIAQELRTDSESVASIERECSPAMAEKYRAAVLRLANLRDRTDPPRTVDTGNGEAESQDRLTAAKSSIPAQKGRRSRSQKTTQLPGPV